MQSHMSVDENKTKATMKTAGIPTAAIAIVKDGKISEEIYLASDGSDRTVAADTLYGAASLSKLVFTYLALKLISEGNFNLKTKLIDMLPFGDFCKKEGFEQDKSVTQEILANVTIESILSHTSGLNIYNNNQIQSQFIPGTQYSYSNLGMVYLQRAIENKMQSDLQSLADKHVFCEDALDMKNSCYYRYYQLGHMTTNEPTPQKICLSANDNGLDYKVVGLNGAVKYGMIAWDRLPKDIPHDVTAIIDSQKEWLTSILGHTSEAGHTSGKSASAHNSLFTTAHDYATFVNAWINSNDPVLQQAFEPRIFMTTDDWAKGLNVPDSDLKHVAWGLGWGLQTNEQNEVVTAYHTADMNDWRAEVAVTLLDKNKTAIVYFADSRYGHILSDQIIAPNAEMNHALKYFFEKYGFVREIDTQHTVALMSEISRQPGVIYINETKNGLRCDVVGLDGKRGKPYTVAWDRLPENYPHKATDILQMKDPFLSTILLEQSNFARIGNFLNPPRGVQPAQVEKGPKPKFSTRNILAKVGTLPGTTVPSKPRSTSSQSTHKEPTSSQDITTKTPANPSQQVQGPSIESAEQRPSHSMTPLSTKLTPPGTIKK